MRYLCSNCGKKGVYKGKLFVKDATHRCCYCEMEFKAVIRKGQMVFRGEVPRFKIEQKSGGKK